MKKNKKKIMVGDNIYSKSSHWKFNSSVASVFDKHVSKSVPLYNEAHSIICKMSDFFIKDKSCIIDIGSSTGTLIKKLNTRHSHKKINFLGIEPEKAMIKKAKLKIKNKNVKFINKSIENFKLPKSDQIMSIYTIQFIPPSKRQSVFNNIYKNLNWGGAFFLFEKIRGPDARFQDILTATYNDHKLDQGYSHLEIAKKTISLKGVLEPFSSQANIDFLKRSGFKDIIIIFKYICFEGILAIK